MEEGGDADDAPMLHDGKARWRKDVSKALKLEKSRKFCTYPQKSLSYKSCQSRDWRRRKQAENHRAARRELNADMAKNGGVEDMTSACAPFVNGEGRVRHPLPHPMTRDDRAAVRGPYKYAGPELPEKKWSRHNDEEESASESE